MTGMGVEVGAQAARSRALAVLRIRSRALAVALLPAAAAVVLIAGGTTGHISGGHWGVTRWIVTGVAVVVLFCAAGIALFVARARPAVSPTVQIAEDSAPDLYRMVRDLADRLDVPAPSAIALTPDCDSWLEDRTHRAQSPPAAESGDDTEGIRSLAGPRHGRLPVAPVLVIGSPFLWWMRVGELRAVLAPVVAGTGPSAHPDIAAARRFVRGLDAAVAVAAEPARGPLARTVLAGVGWVTRLLLRSCRGHAAEMERGVAAAAAERAQAVDYGVRIVAQEQVGLAYAGWDRLLTRVALPAWRMGRWPSRLDAGVVAALTELSRRDRLAEGFTSRLGERPACDLLEEPGVVDEAASLLAARLFHGGPAECGPDWAPVGWQEYPDEVVDRTWRTDAARLHRVLDAQGVHVTTNPTTRDVDGPTLSRVLDHLTVTAADTNAAPAAPGGGRPERTGAAGPAADPADPTEPAADSTEAREHHDDEHEQHHHEGEDGDDGDRGGVGNGDGDEGTLGTERTATLAAGLSAELAREEAAAPVRGGGTEQTGPDRTLWDDGMLPLFPLQPPRSGREILADHVTAMICCAAMDTAGAIPGLDWLDGPTLLINGERAADLTPRVLTLIEDGDPTPLRSWLHHSGIRPEKPVRLV
ncbi:M48 family metalloprotease [Streptomyces avermitilis]|uniref:hypothetical protein n=1 Tax=Streptomyces avermitilis TaxID=33903 RepID=UPI00380692E4